MKLLRHEHSGHIRTQFFLLVACCVLPIMAHSKEYTTPRIPAVLQPLENKNPICREREKWRYIAEGNVAPKKFEAMVLYKLYPQFYKAKIGPDGSTIYEGLPEKDSLYRDLCAMLCLTTNKLRCRFYAFVYPFICVIAEHTNDWESGVAFSNPFYEVPRVCLPNDGCKAVGEYFADSFSRCHFYQCAPGDYSSLRATRHACPRATITRSSFLTSRDEPYFTQPCSEYGFDCRRPFPIFAP